MSIFSSLKPKANASRNAFDLSRRDVFSAKTGMLTPCFVLPTLPNSVYEVDSLSILRTIPVQSAPFARMSQNVEYYFVPYSQLFHDFERLYYERGDVQRNVGNVSSPTTASLVPHFDLYQVVGNFFKQYCYLRIYKYLKAQPEFLINNQYRHIIDVVFHSSAPNVSLELQKDVHGRLCIEDSMRIFDMLRYGNYLPDIKFLYEYVTHIESTIDDLPTLKGDALAGNASQLHDDCISYVNTWANVTYVNSYFAKLQGRRPNILALAAYLKVWADMYRNTQYDVSENYAYFFNYDYVVSDSLALIPVSKVFQLLKPRYRQWKKDIFTGSYPTAQFGSVAVAATENPVYISSSSSATGTAAAYNVKVSNAAGAAKNKLYFDTTTDGDKYLWNVDASVSAISIRQAMAFQKYKEKILRAGNRTTALQTAMFGDRSRFIENNYVDFLGATSANLDFNTVAATSDSQSSVVGELASNGIATNSSSAFTYHSHDFGVIIGMFYILPEAEYEAYMIEPSNTYTETFDFYKDSFQNLGLQPVFNFDFNIMPNAERSNTDEVLGYMARYWPYKTSVDLVHGEFYGSLPDSMSAYIAKLQEIDPGHDTDWISIYTGAFSEFVTPRSSQAFRQLVLNSLYVEPTCVDNIFYVTSDETQATDQFKINMNHRVKSVLPMSVVGLPQ